MSIRPPRLPTAFGSQLVIAHTRSNPFCTRFVRPGSIAYQFHTETKAESSTDQSSIGTSSIGTSSDTNCQRIARQLVAHQRSLIIGPHGTGKTTLLCTLAPYLEASFDFTLTVRLHAPHTKNPHINNWRARIANRRQNAKLVHDAIQRLRAGSGRTLLIIDGLEQLSWRARWWTMWSASSTGARILATSHHPTPRFQIVHQTWTDSPTIKRLTSQLTADQSNEIQATVNEALSRRELTPDTNVRDLWFELYDLVEQ